MIEKCWINCIIFNFIILSSNPLLLDLEINPSRTWTLATEASHEWEGPSQQVIMRGGVLDDSYITLEGMSVTFGCCICMPPGYWNTDHRCNVGFGLTWLDRSSKQIRLSAQQRYLWICQTSLAFECWFLHATTLDLCGSLIVT